VGGGEIGLTHTRVSPMCKGARMHLHFKRYDVFDAQKKMIQS